MNDLDPIVAEVRRIREEHAAQFGYDPEAIFADIKEREKRSGRTYVSYADEQKSTSENDASSRKVRKTG